MRKFVALVNNEVAFITDYPDSFPEGYPMDMEKIIAALRSDPKIMEIVDSSTVVEEGYVWDGVSFNPPS